MKNKRTFFVSRILPLVLIAVMALSVVSCETQNKGGTDGAVEKTFTFEAYDLDGTSIYSGEITSALATVGAALVEKGLIEGEVGAYGLYVESVCGVLADYNTDGSYWAFYLGEEYSMTGIDRTDIEDGGTYCLRRTK